MTLGVPADRPNQSGYSSIVRSESGYRPIPIAAQQPRALSDCFTNDHVHDMIEFTRFSMLAYRHEDTQVFGMHKRLGCSPALKQAFQELSKEPGLTVVEGGGLAPAGVADRVKLTGVSGAFISETDSDRMASPLSRCSKSFAADSKLSACRQSPIAHRRGVECHKPTARALP